jgi:PIN domain nuclease of toxin-antitoxin system
VKKQRTTAAREHGAAVSDTHPLIFHAAGGKHLSPLAANFFSRCEHQEAILYIPTAVIWECVLLARVGKIRLNRSAREFFNDLFSNPSYQPLDIQTEHVLLADENRFSRDPFDGLIVAAAKATGLPLLTRDVTIQDSGGIETIW